MDDSEFKFRLDRTWEATSDAAVLEAALAAQRRDGGELADHLARLGASADRIGELVARAAGHPFGEAGAPLGFRETSGRYTRERRFSSGGMGRILIVYDTVLERDVALKELLPERLCGGSGSGPGPLARFVQEGKITGQLEHPGIVPVYELGQRTDGSYYYTMKFVRGRSLEDAIADAKTLEARLELLPHFVDLCHAVGYAHSRGVIHRDIKPSNVMVGAFGETVVIDWGLAKIRGAVEAKRSTEDTLAASPVHVSGSLTPPDSKTEVGSVMGTPDYMAPEQALGRGDEVDERSDVYSLGTVLFKLLTGDTPFKGVTQQEKLNRVVNEDPPRPTEVAPGVPPELEAICLRAMNKEPGDRFTTALEMAKEIARFQAGALVMAYEYGVTDLFRRFVRRYRVQLAAIGVTIAVALMVAAIAYRNILAANARERSAREAAESVQYYSGIQLADARLEDGRRMLAQDALAHTPPTRRDWEWGHLVHEAFPPDLAADPETLVRPDAGRPQAALWQSPTSVVRALRIRGHAAGVAVISAAFSADGLRLCTASLDNTVKIWDALSGTLLRSLDFEGSPLMSARLTANGSRVVTLEWDRAKIWDVESGRLLAICSTPGLPGSVQCWLSPDEGLLLSSHRDGSVYVWDAQSGALRTVLRGHTGEVRSAAFLPSENRVATAGVDPTIRIWDLATGAELERISPPGVRFAVSPDFRYYSGGPDYRTLRLWDAARGSELPWSIRVESDVQGFAFSSDSSAFVTGEVNGKLRVWRAADGAELASVGGTGSPIVHVDFSPDASRIVTCANDGSVYIWSPRRSGSGGAPDELIAHDGGTAVIYAGCSPDASRMATCGYDKTAVVWDLASGGVVSRYRGHTTALKFAEFTPDGERVVSVDWGGEVHVWSADSGEARVKISHDPGPLLRSAGLHGGIDKELRWLGLRMSTAISADGRWVVVHDGIALRVHDLATGAAVCTLEDSGNWGIGLPTFSPDGRRVTCNAFHANSTRVWDAATGRAIATLDGNKGPITMASFDPSGTRVLTASLDRTARLFDAQSGALLHTMEGHTVFVVGAVFSGDGRHVVTSAADGTARLWDAATGAPRAALAGHSEYVTGAAFNPEGTRVVTVSKDHTAGVWSLDGEELAVLKRSRPGTGPLERVAPEILFARWDPSGRVIITCWSDGVVHVFRSVDWSRLAIPFDGAEDLEKHLRAATQ